MQRYIVDNKNLEIAIRSKKDFSYVEKCEVQLRTQPFVKLETIIYVLKTRHSKIFN